MKEKEIHETNIAGIKTHRRKTALTQIMNVSKFKTDFRFCNILNPLACPDGQIV
jgi:hypothetical protein